MIREKSFFATIKGALCLVISKRSDFEKKELYQIVSSPLAGGKGVIFIFLDKK